MAVKVLIERTAKPGMEKFLPALLRQLRSEAMHQPGYQYGETWRSAKESRAFLVISTWSSAAHWEMWQKDPMRQKLESKMRALLDKRPSIRIYEEYSETSGVLR